MSGADSPPPPSYQLSLEEFDQKTSQVVQNAPEVDEDGWPIYDPAAFESAAENHERSPPSSSSARISRRTTNRREVHGHRSSARVSSAPLKLRTVTSERDSEPEDEHRAASPPPPFTPTGPSLDGPPFDQVVGSSYYGPDSIATSILEPYPPSPRSPSPPPPPPPPVHPPVQPLRLRPTRLPTSQVQTSPNTYSSHRPPLPIPKPTSSIAHVEFDPQTAYLPYGGSRANHTHIRPDAAAFYNHAVASMLTANSAEQTQPGNVERVSSPHSGGYTPTTWAQQATPPPVSFHEQYAPHVANLNLSVSAVPPGVRDYRSSPSGTIRGPVSPVPNSLAQLRWAGSEQQIMRDVWGNG